MSRRALVCVVLSALLLSGLAGFPQPGAGQSQPIKFGIVVPLTGVVAPIGLEQRVGAEMVFDEANETGGLLNGRKIVVVAEDSQNNNTAAVNAFNKVAAEKAVAVIASVLGTQMLAMQPLIKERRIPTLTPSGTRSVTQQGNVYIFRFYPHDGIAKVAQVRFAVRQLNAKKPAILFTDDQYGHSGRDIMVEELTKLGVKPVAMESVADADKDLTVPLTKIRDSGADVLLLQLQTGNTIAVAKQISQLGITIPVVANNTYATPAVLGLLTPDEVRGAYTETAVVPSASTDPRMVQFIKKYAVRTKKLPGHFAAISYDSASMLVAAIKKASSTDPDAIVRALRSIKYNGAVTEFEVDKEGNANHTDIIYKHVGQNDFKLAEVFRLTVEFER
jgi:branched-chain amino acid transport system substrate-binding protein